MLIAQACEQAFHSERVANRNSFGAWALLLSICFTVYTSRGQLLSAPDTNSFPSFYKSGEKGNILFVRSCELKKRCVKNVKMHLSSLLISLHFLCLASSPHCYHTFTKTVRVNITSRNKPFESSPKKRKEEHERGSDEPKGGNRQPTIVSSERRLSLANNRQFVDLDDDEKEVPTRKRTGVKNYRHW